jgi:hypothetical protein
MKKRERESYEMEELLNCLFKNVSIIITIYLNHYN